MKVVIVGGVAGGASAATRARRLSETAEIVLFERGPAVSFANCGMPYYIGGEILDRDKLLVVSPERMHQRYQIDVRLRTNVESIDRQAKTVHVKELSTGREYDEPYDKLILAPGAAPFRPPIDGLDLPGVFTLRNLEDMDRIKAMLDAGVQRAVVVGAGFIGLEMVENLVNLGVAVTLVELQDQTLPPLDREMAASVADCLLSHNVDLKLKDSVIGIAVTDSGLTVTLQSGNAVEAQLVVLGVGVRPENQLAVAAGLEVGPRGGILVNRHMQTNDPDIYAVGDAVQVEDFVTGQPTQIPLAGPANRQGRIAADHVFGRLSQFRGSQGTAIVRVFNLTIALTGATEKQLTRLRIPFRKIYIHPTDHAGYYPGAERMSLKLLFDPHLGRILGAQAVGGNGVDTRIDVLAIAIQAKMTVFDLEEAELAYSPQYGSAKDAINMAGFVAAGLLREDHPQVDFAELIGKAESARPVIDVRTQREYEKGHVPGAVNIPVDELRERIAEVPRDARVHVYCQVGQRGYLATRILRQNGIDAHNLAGGFTTYQMLARAAELAGESAHFE